MITSQFVLTDPIAATKCLESHYFQLLPSIFNLAQTKFHLQMQAIYRIAGFFEDKNFHELAFPRFLRGKFSQIVTDYKEYPLKREHFKGKIFTNCFRFMKFTKIFPLENNLLYGIQIAKIKLIVISHQRYLRNYL